MPAPPAWRPNCAAGCSATAPPSRHAATHQNRLWLIDAEDPNRLWFSNEIFEGQPTTFGRGNQLRIDGLPSAPTALASNGDRLVVFTAVGIYYLVGQGPDMYEIKLGGSEALNYLVAARWPTK